MEIFSCSGKYGLSKNTNAHVFRNFYTVIKWWFKENLFYLRIAYSGTFIHFKPVTCHVQLSNESIIYNLMILLLNSKEIYIMVKKKISSEVCPEYLEVSRHQWVKQVLLMIKTIVALNDILHLGILVEINYIKNILAEYFSF